MNIYCWKDVALIIHIRVDCDERVQNLNKVMNHYRAASPEIQFIIVEDDKESHPALQHLINSSLLRPGDKYRLIKNEDAYRRPLAYNLGALMTDREVLGFVDTDVIIHPASLDMVRRCLLDKTFDFMWPHNGVALYLNKLGRDKFFENPIIENLSQFFPATPEGHPIALKDKLFLETSCLRVENVNSKGGFSLMHRDCFNLTGGWNIDFKGWGYEDNEIEVRMAKLNQKIGRVHGPMEVLFHLWHPRSKENASVEPEHEFLQNNMGILESIVQADIDQIMQWIECQKLIVKEMWRNTNEIRANGV